MTFDHVGLVVRTLDEGRRHLQALFGIDKWTEAFTDPVNGVYVQFGIDGSKMCYELIAPIDESSPVTKVLASGRNILNHMAYLVRDMTKAANDLLAQGCVATGPAQPAVAYGGRKIQFFLTPMRFLIEIIEAPGHRHSYKLSDKHAQKVVVSGFLLTVFLIILLAFFLGHSLL